MRNDGYYYAELIKLLYISTVSVKFFIIYLNFDEISLIVQTITEHLRDEAYKRAIKHERNLNIIVLLYYTYSTITLASTLYVKNFSSNYKIQNGSLNQFVFESFGSPIREIIINLDPVSANFNDVVNAMFQFCYFNFCIQICSLLKQFEDDLGKLNLVSDEKEIKELIKQSVAFHHEILRLTANMVNIFENIISINFVLDVLLLGFALSFSYNSKLNNMATIYITFILFDAWTFCYASEKIISKVRFLFIAVTIR